MAISTVIQPALPKHRRTEQGTQSFCPLPPTFRQPKPPDRIFCQGCYTRRYFSLHLTPPPESRSSLKNFSLRPCPQTMFLFPSASLGKQFRVEGSKCVTHNEETYFSFFRCVASLYVTLSLILAFTYSMTLP